MGLSKIIKWIEYSDILATISQCTYPGSIDSQDKLILLSHPKIIVITSLSNNYVLVLTSLDQVMMALDPTTTRT